ncbi:MAG: hypothetical protein M1837_007533 [Sclerophora amabilis]|nr:MAG: hypothetical protein M1837_007533 [Sclerophora amabilis]
MSTRSHFSSRISKKRRAHRAISASNQYQGNKHVSSREAEEFGDFSDEDDDSGDESLERKMARLKREIEEVREEVGQRKIEKQRGETRDGQHNEPAEEEDQQVSALSNMLDDIALPNRQATFNPQSTFNDKVKQPIATNDTDTNAASPSKAAANGNLAPIGPGTSSHNGALQLTSEFDSRLTALESLLGTPTALSPSPILPILPTILTLSEKLSALTTTLTTSPPSSLDAVSQRIHRLTSEAESLSAPSRRQGVSHPSSSSHSLTPPDQSLTPEVVQKINSLHAILPTLTHLSPTLAPLLERLRSLRRLHSEATSAAQGLDELERRQGMLEGEIGKWREGLERLEGKVKEGEGTMGENVKVVEAWVKGLEARVKDLGS